MPTINDNRYLGGFQAQRDGAQMKVIALFVSRTQPDITETYTRSMPPAEYGEWTHEFLSTTDPGPNLRLMIDDDGMIIAIGHATEERWFDPRAPHEVSYTQRRISRVAKALRHINLHRARYGHHELNRTDWTDDDVLKHALDLGFTEDA